MTSTEPARRGRYDGWMYRTMNDRRFTHLYATRSQRRRIVAAHVVLTAAGTAGMVLLNDTGRLWWSALLLGALAAWVPTTGLLNSMTRGLLELRPELLDERQRAERSAVLARAHRGTLVIMVGGFAAFFVAHSSGADFADLAMPIALAALAVLEIHWLLPLWTAALRTPDDPGDPDDSGDVDGTVGIDGSDGSDDPEGVEGTAQPGGFRAPGTAGASGLA